MTIQSLKIQDALEIGFVPEYERVMQFLHGEISRLNNDVFIVEQILSFPIFLFPGTERPLFFRRIIDNFLDAILLRITKLTMDKSSDLYTLPGIRTDISTKVKKEYRTLFEESLKKTEFDWSLYPQVKRLRNKRIAHFTKVFAFGIPEDERPSFAELNDLCTAINSQLQSISFGTYRALTPWGHDDINGILDCIAKCSVILNMSEENPELWLQWKENFQKNELDTLNQYRKKFG